MRRLGQVSKLWVLRKASQLGLPTCTVASFSYLGAFYARCAQTLSAATGRFQIPPSKPPL